MTVSMAVILMPELFGTGLGAGEMVAGAGRDWVGFFMSVRNSLPSRARAQTKSPGGLRACAAFGDWPESARFITRNS